MRVTDELKAPLMICPNLAAGIAIGGGYLTITYANRPGREGRVRYRWEVIFPNGSDMSDDDLQSGCQGGNLTSGFCSLLSFVTAAIESREYREHKGIAEIDPDTNENAFPAKVLDFLAPFNDELTMVQCEIEERSAE